MSKIRKMAVRRFQHHHFLLGKQFAQPHYLDTKTLKMVPQMVPQEKF